MPTSYTAQLPTDILIDSATLYCDLSNGLSANAGLAIDAVAEKFKTTSEARYQIAGVRYTKAATPILPFTAAHVITASLNGVVLVQVNAAGTISTKVPTTPQAYANAPAALAALPAPDAGNVALGYIAIANNAGDWTANTDDLTAASDVTTAVFNNSTLTALTILGGTRGGITFDPGEEWRNVPFDGSRGPIANLDRRVMSNPKMTGTLLLFGQQAIKEVLEPGSSSAVVGSAPNAVATITPFAPGQMLPLASYHKYELLYDRGNGGTAKITFPFGLNIGWSLSGQDNNEGEIPINIEARQDPAVVLASGAYVPYTIELAGPDIS